MLRVQLARLARTGVPVESGDNGGLTVNFTPIWERFPWIARDGPLIPTDPKAARGLLHSGAVFGIALPVAVGRSPSGRSDAGVAQW